MNYKKLLIGLISIITALTLAACGEETNGDENTENPAETETAPETEDVETDDAEEAE